MGADISIAFGCALKPVLYAASALGCEAGPMVERVMSCVTFERNVSCSGCGLLAV
jgi:hypothetical protein